MKYIITSWLVFLCVHLCLSKKGIPSYITVCHRSNPDFDKCCLDSANKALPFIFKGDKKFNTPSFLPLNVEQVSYTSAGGLAAKATNIKFYGFENVTIEKLKVDLNNKHLELNLFVDRIRVDGKYEFKGTTGLLQINAKGHTNSTFYGYRCAIDMGYHLITKDDGKEYLEFEEPRAKTSFENVSLWFENLFPGNPEITAVTNKALNDNWKEFIDDFQPLLSEITLNIGINLLKNVAADNPFDEVFPE